MLQIRLDILEPSKCNSELQLKKTTEVVLKVVPRTPFANRKRVLNVLFFVGMKNELCKDKKANGGEECNSELQLKKTTEVVLKVVPQLTLPQEKVTKCHVFQEVNQGLLGLNKLIK